jgi:death-on-curing family protein
VMRTDGGDARLLSEAGLHQMVFSVNRIDDIHCRAAQAFFTLIAYPAFRDGNSRTAQRVADWILNDNGYTPEDRDIEMTGLVQGIADFTVEVADIKEWLRSHYIEKGNFSR